MIDQEKIERECSISEINNLRNLKRLLLQDPPDVKTALERLNYNINLLDQFIIDTAPQNNEVSFDDDE